MATATAIRSSISAVNADVAHWSRPAKVRAAHREAAYATDRMHPGVFASAIGSYGAMLLALWILFGTDTLSVLSLFVCTAYFGMYFGVPVAMYRIAKKAALAEPATGSFARFLRGDLETVTGSVSGWSALTQVLVVPVSLTFGLIAMGIIVKLSA